MPERLDIAEPAAAEPGAAEHRAPSGSAPAGADGGPSAEKARRRRWPLALLALGLLLLVAAAGLALWQGLRPDDGMEPNVVVGPMGDYTDEEIEAMLKDKVDAGMIAFSINAQVVLESPDAQAPLLFENPGNNAKLLRMRLVRDDTGEAVYETGFLAPGTYVGKDELDVRLAPGAYTCTATVSAYREDTRAPLGEAAAEVVLTVLDPEAP